MAFTPSLTNLSLLKNKTTNKPTTNRKCCRANHDSQRALWTEISSRHSKTIIKIDLYIKWDPIEVDGANRQILIDLGLPHHRKATNELRRHHYDKDTMSKYVFHNIHHIFCCCKYYLKRMMLVIHYHLVYDAGRRNL